MKEDFNWNEGDEPMELIGKFEKMLEEGGHIFFDVEDLETIIDFYLDTQNTDMASKALQIANEQHPFSSSFRIREARCKAYRKDYYDALEILSEIEQVEQADEEVFITKAEVYSLMGNHELAVEEYDKALIMYKL